MITILLSENDKNAKEMLSRLLKDSGYAMPTGRDGQNSIIKIMGKAEIENGGALKNKVIELGDALYKEKRGALYKSILEEIEKPLIEHVLEKTEGNQLKASKILGINRNTMRTKIKKFNIDINRWKT